MRYDYSEKNYMINYVFLSPLIKYHKKNLFCGIDLYILLYYNVGINLNISKLKIYLGDK